MFDELVKGVFEVEGGMKLTDFNTITNFGLIGSQVGSACSYCDAPSAMWPAPCS